MYCICPDLYATRDQKKIETGKSVLVFRSPLTGIDRKEIGTSELETCLYVVYTGHITQWALLMTLKPFRVSVVTDSRNAPDYH